MRDIHPKQKLYLNDSENNPWFVTKGKRKTEVVLERWLFELNRAFLEQQEENGNDIQEEEEVEEEEDNNNNNNHRHHPDHHHHNDNNNYSSSNDPTSDEPLPAIYKKCIVLFRDLFTYINLLPATKLRKTIDNYNIDDHGSKVSYQNLRIGIRILKGNQPISSKGRIGLSKELISTYTNISNESDDLRPHLSDEKFKSIDTPFGNFKVSVQYRKDTNFYLNKKVSEVENTAGSSNIAEVDENQNKRVSLLSNQSGSPPIENVANHQQHQQQIQQHKQESHAKVQPQQTTLQRPSLDVLQNPEGKQVAKAIPIINRSSSNVSLAALLRNVKGNQSSTSYNIGSYNAGTSIPKSFTSSYAGSLVSNNFSSNAIPISPNNNYQQQQQYIADYQIGSTGSQPKYSSSFSSRHKFQPGQQRKSFMIGNNSSQSNNAISRNPSLESRRYSDLEPPSQLYIDDDINDFIKLVDNKKDLKVGASPNTTNLNDSLLKFKSMRTSNNILGESVGDGAMINSNSPPASDSSQKARLSSLPPSSYSIGSNYSISMNRVGSFTNGIPATAVAARAMSPQVSSNHQYSIPSNSPHSHSGNMPTIPSRLSGSLLPSNNNNNNFSNESTKVSPNSGVIGSYHNNRHNHNNSNLSLHHRGSSNELDYYNGNYDETARLSSLPQHIGVGISGAADINYYNRQHGFDYGNFQHQQHLNYDIGSAPLPIMASPFASSGSASGGGGGGGGGVILGNQSNPYLPQPNAYSYTLHNNYNFNDALPQLGGRNAAFNGGGDNSTFAEIDNRLIAHRYKPNSNNTFNNTNNNNRALIRHNSSGINLPSLQNYVSRPSMAITTTTNAYAKMNNFNLGNEDGDGGEGDNAQLGAEVVAHRREMEQANDREREEEDANIDDDIIFPLHDIDIGKDE